MSWFGKRERTASLPRNKRIAMLIGGGGVLGRALIAGKPGDVCIINITKSSTIAADGVFPYHYDVAREAEECMEFVFRSGRPIDVLINAAYTSNFRPIGALTKAGFIDEFVLNTFIPNNLAALCVKHIWSKLPPEENRLASRKVINISSGAAFGKTARPDLASYSGTKAALNVMTEYLHDYLQPYGVTAHVIAPGSLTEKSVMDRTVDSIWKLQSEKATDFSLEKIW